MDPLQPWVDADEVRRLAAKLIQPASDPAADVAACEAGFDEGFVGFTGERPVPPEAPPAQVAAVMASASNAPIAPAPSPATAAAAASPPPTARAFEKKATPDPAPQSARGPFLEKIRRLSDWMGREYGAAGVFILDREGAVIFDDGTHGRLHFLARSLALASRRPGSTPGNVHVKIGAGTTLEVIPVETPYGCLVLGAVVSTSLSTESVQSVMAALSAIASPGDASREEAGPCHGMNPPSRTKTMHPYDPEQTITQERRELGEHG